MINFTTYSKSFKNKRRYKNAPENWVIHKNVHEPIIDRETFELVQKKNAATKRRAPKKENAKKSIFCDLLICADCGHKLWSHVNPRNKSIHFFSCSNYKKDYRGTCESRHYVRTDAVEQIVKAELKRLAARNEKVLRLYEKSFEDNADGKMADELFMALSHKYEVERLELKASITAAKQKLAGLDDQQRGKEMFVRAIRKFMQMETLTAPLLQELIDHIDVYETEGTGKNKTQRIVIYYRFVGYIELPEELPESSYTADTRQGVAIEYLTHAAPA